MARILIDVTRTFHSGLHTGIQRVVRGLLHGLQQLAEAGAAPSVHAVLLDQPAARVLNQLPPHPLQAGAATATLATPAPQLTPLQPQPGDLLLLADAAWYCDPWSAIAQLQRQQVRIVGMIHDLLPLQRPHWFRPGLQPRFRHYLHALAATAEALLVPSRHVLGQLRAALPAPPRLHCLPHGSDLGSDLGSNLQEPWRAGPGSLPAQVGFGGTPWFLAVGTLEPRKNHPLLLDAFERLWASGAPHPLVLVGSAGWCVEALIDRIRHHPRSGELLYWLEDVDDTQLISLYRQACASLYLSEDEGFGLPVLEARQLGCPVIATDIAVLRESGGDWPRYLAPATLAQDLPAALIAASTQTDPLAAPSPRRWIDVAREFLIGVNMGGVGNIGRS